MDALIRLLRNLWLGHALLAGACLWALHVHATYRVPLGLVSLLLPWLGVAITGASVLMLIVSLLPGGDDGPLARAFDRLDRRAVRLSVVLVPLACLASAYASATWLSLGFLGLGLAVAAASLGSIARGLIAHGGGIAAESLRWLQRVVLVAIGAFLLWTLVVFVNGAWDRSMPVEHDSEVLAVVPAVVDAGFGELVFHTRVDLRSWRSPDRRERLGLASREARYIWVGEPVRVRQHAGRLHIPWVSAVTLDEVRHSRQVLAVSPAAFHAMKRLVALLLERRQWDEALVVARRFVATYPDDIGGIEHVAGLLGIAGRYADQIELIEPVVARRPEYRPLYMLGFALDRSGAHHRAIEVLERATRLQPDDFLAWHYLGEANQAIERYEAAIAAYEHELTIRPRSREVRRRVQVFRAYLATRDARTAVTQ
jgi:tetratricopeptide (TPR) repeat protein